MKKYKFVIHETGHARVYNSFDVCKRQAVRCMKSLIKRGLIFGKPEIEFYSIENGRTYFIPCETPNLD